MNAVEVLGGLVQPGVNYITPEQAALLMSIGAEPGVESQLEVPVVPGIRILCKVRLDLSYKKVWIDKRVYRAEAGAFALEAKTLEDARLLHKQVEDMHFRDVLGEI